MNNPTIFQVQFNMMFGEKSSTLLALVKPAENRQQYQVIRLQFLNPRENTSVIDNFYITKTIKENIPVWVHTNANISSSLLEAVGNAIDRHHSAVLP